MITDNVFPIFLAEERDVGPPRVSEFRGTGFRVNDNLLVTCLQVRLPCEQRAELLTAGVEAHILPALLRPPLNLGQNEPLGIRRIVRNQLRRGV